MFGLLNINKPAGWTSRDVVNQIGRLVGKQAKVGHAGTLDPLATGVLVVCVGSATRLVPWIHDRLKSYEAAFLLGQRSDTDDTDGVVEPVPVDVPPSFADLQAVLPDFIGSIQQVPPAYSALKVNGRRAYAMARAGETVELASREVFVSENRIVDYQFPELRLSIECGTGTYIRSIGRDLARRVGTEAVMSSLVRTRIGTFNVEDSVSPDALTAENIASFVQDPLPMLDHLPLITVSNEDAQRLIFGQTLPWPKSVEQRADANVVIRTEADGLVAIGGVKAGRMAPQSVFKPRR